MKAILLAAGYATRLYPLTHDFPKPLLPVGGKPILEWLVEDVGDAVEEFIVVTNHRFFTHFSTWAKELDYNIRVLCSPFPCGPLSPTAAAWGPAA